MITDHTKGKITREKLLEKWIDLLDYVVFIQGYTRVELPKLCSSRINFAFLDGAHTYEDVMFEFNHVSCFQERGDVIVFDDYNLKLFPGIVKAVNEIKMSKIYSIDIIDSENDRAYVIATRLKKSINRLR